MRPIATDVSVVGLSVCDVTLRYPAKMAGPIEMPFGVWGEVGHIHHVLDGDPDPPREWAILGWRGGSPIVKYMYREH